MTALARQQIGGEPVALAPRGFDSDRTAAAFVAVAVVGFSTPQVLNFFRLLPVGAALLLVALHLASRSTGRVGRVRVPLVAVAVLLWCGLTVFWSDGPGITVVETVSTALAMAVAVIVGSFSSTAALVRGVALGGVLVVVLSLAVAAVDPSTGLMPPGYQGGTLRGIYVHRNILAGVLTLPLAAALASRWGGRRPRATWVAVVGTQLVGIAATASSTSVATAAALVALAAMLWAMRRTALRWRMIGLLVVLALSLLAAWEIDVNSSSVFAVLQRNDTLTGRTLIWEAVGLLISRQPWTGYGWGATWDPSDYVESWVSAYAKFQVPSAHNGYLDTWIQIGLVGLVLFLLLLAAVLLAGARAMLRSDDVVATFAPLLVVALVVHNLSETNLVDLMVVFVLVTTLTRLRAWTSGRDVRVDRTAGRRDGAGADRAVRRRSAGAAPAA